MLDGVQGSDKVIRPGRFQKLLASYKEKVKRGEIKPEENSGQRGSTNTQDASGTINLGLCGNSSETYTLCE